MTICLLLHHVREAALAAGLTVLVLSHEDAGAANRVGALGALVRHLNVIAVTSDLVVLRDAHRDVRPSF